MRRSALALGLLLLATSPGFGAVEITNVGVDGSLGFDIDGDLIAIRSAEARSGNTDLNGDGDTIDFVLQVYDASTGNLVNTGLEASGGLRMSGNYVAFSVYETRQGATDLNPARVFDGSEPRCLRRQREPSGGYGSQRRR